MMETPKRIKVLQAYQQWEGQGLPYGPTIRWIAEYCGISPATATQHNNILYSNGRLIRLRDGQHPRNYKLTRTGYNSLIRAKCKGVIVNKCDNCAKLQTEIDRLTDALMNLRTYVSADSDEDKIIKQALGQERTGQ